MEKKEYIDLYTKWTKADNHKESAVISKEILDKAFEELKLLEKVYDDCGMQYESPCFRRVDTIWIDHVEKIRLIRLNSLELTINVYSSYDDKWQDVVMNVKHFGEKGRNDLKQTLLEEAIAECNSNISEAEYKIKNANETIAEFTKKRATFEKKLTALKGQEEKK